MSDNPSRSRPSARLWWPSAPWDDYVFAYISRDTRGCQLTSDERLNRFPASAYCTITWFVEGQVELLACGGAERREVLPRSVVGGCQTHPVLSRNLGDSHGFIALFHPDAFHALFGIELGRLQDAYFDARALLPAHAQSLVEDVSAAADDGGRQQAVESFLARHGQARPAGVWRRLRRWPARITLPLASRLFGVGARQMQRLALRQTGLNLKTLLKLWRGERSFIRAQRKALRGEPFKLADHASELGYADQAHFAREVKALTGYTPTQLVREVWTDEANWIYRLEYPSDEPSPPARSP